MTERERHEAIQAFSLICQTCANTGITAARKGDTETTIHTAQQIIQAGTSAQMVRYGETA